MAKRAYAGCSTGLETLEPRLLLTTDPTVYAQYMLELIDAARANPVAAATQFGIDLNEGLAANTISPLARQPLAFNSDLLDAAFSHNVYLQANNLLTHVGSGNTTPRQRMQNAGYAFTSPSGSDEAIGFVPMGSTPLPSDVLNAVPALFKQLFTDQSTAGRLNRLALLSDNSNEAGIALLTGPYQGVTLAELGTLDFAFQKGNPFLTGVVYDNRLVLLDSAFTPGEGLGGVTVTAAPTSGSGSSFTTTTLASGGYSLQVPAGTYDLQFSGGPIQGAFVIRSVQVTTQNIKQDLVLDQPPSQLNVFVPPLKAGQDLLYATPGSTVSFSSSVQNGGTINVTTPFEVVVILSDTDPPAATDTRVVTYTINQLNAGATDTRTVTFAAPATAGTYYLAELIDPDHDETPPGTPDLWGPVVALIVGNPDIQETFGTITLPTTLVPGDSGTVPVVLTNAGTIPSGGTATVTVYATQDATFAGPGPAPGDVLLTTVANKKVGLAPDASLTVSAKVSITDALPPGAWQFRAVLDTSNITPDNLDTQTDIVMSFVYPLVWQFGTLPGRKSAKLAVHDTAGNLVTFSLSGGGYGEVLGGADFTNVNLIDAMPSTKVKITPPSGKTTSVGDIICPASISSISGAVEVRGNITIGGTISTLSLGDLPATASQHLIQLSVGLPYRPSVESTLTFGNVLDASIQSNYPLKSLKVLNWEDTGGEVDLIQARAIGTLTVSGRKASKTVTPLPGDFNATLQVAGAISTVSIAGNLGGQWNALAIKSLTVKGDLAGATLGLTQGVDPKLSALGTLSVTGWVRDTRILAAGNVGKVTAGGIDHFDLYAGVRSGVTGLPEPTTDFVANATIQSVKVTAKVLNAGGFATIDSNLAAAHLGSVTLAFALAANIPPTPWGLAAHTLDTYSYRDSTITYTWVIGSATAPTIPGGDFEARLA